MAGPRKIEVAVPAWYIKDKAVNYPLEILAATGAALELEHGGESVSIRPATLGFFMLLEWAGSTFFKSPKDAGVEDIAAAIICANGGKSLFPPNKATVAAMSRKLAADSGAAIVYHAGTIFEWLLATPYTGYEMLRNKGRERRPEPFLFAGPSIAAIVNAGASYAGMTPEQSIWELPLALAGHLVAVNDCGKMDPARPKDEADLKVKTEEAIRREIAGELQPWQIKYPELYPLSFRQAKKQKAYKEQSK